MNNIKGVLRNKLRQRPFDFYVAVLLFIVGLYSIVSDTWPENVENKVVSTIIVIISLYLMVASVMIMSSLSCKRQNHPVLALMGEMYGWMFVASASLATLLLYLGSLIGNNPSSWWAFAAMIVVWGGMLLASIVRFLDLLIIYRGLKK
jgi:hypothetical protein